MAERDKITELYELLPKGYFNDENELRGYVTDDDKLKEVYSFLPQGYFKDEIEYTSYFGDAIKKKKYSPLGLASKGQTVLQELGQPLNESSTPPPSLISEKSKNRETTAIGDVLRSLKSGSLRALGGITGTPQFFNRTITGLAVRPFVKAQGGTDQDANIMLDAVLASQPIGQSILGGAKAQEELNKVAKKTEAKMMPIEGGIVENIGNGDLGKAGELLMRGVFQSAPYLAMTAATAGGGTAAVLGTIGATSAAQQYAELEGKPEGKRALNAWLYGGFEAAGELVTAGIVNSIGRAYKQGVIKEVKENFVKGASKQIAKDFGLEGSSEAATQIGQNLTDIITGIDPNRKIFDGVLDAGLIGGVSGGGLGVANIGASILGRAIASSKEIEKVQSNVNQQAILIDQIESTDSDPVKSALEARLKTLKYEAAKVIDANYHLAEQMSPEQKTKAAELYSVWNELQSKIDNNEVTEAQVPTLEATIDGIKEQIQTLKQEIASDVAKKEAKNVVVEKVKEGEAKPKTLNPEEIAKRNNITFLGKIEGFEGSEGLDLYNVEANGQSDTFSVPSGSNELTVKAKKEQTLGRFNKSQESVFTKKPPKTPYVEINSENISELEKKHLDLLVKENVTPEKIALDKENIDIAKNYINGKTEGKNVYGDPSELPETFGRISEIKSEGEGGDGRTLQEIYDGRRAGNRTPRVTPEEQATNLTAPNGEKSNLSPENHAYVRTPEFKQRFGDWQKGEGSLVLDANGEPLLVYSGQGKLHIEGIEPGKAGVKKIHFTGDKGLAAQYARFRKKQPVVYKGFINITDPTEINRWHENQQEFLITKKEQFIPRGIEDAMDIYKPKTETGGIEDAGRKETQNISKPQEGISQQEQGGEVVNGIRNNDQTGLEEGQEVTTNLNRAREIEKTVKDEGYIFEVDADLDPDFSTLTVYDSSKTPIPIDELPTGIKELADEYTQLIQASRVSTEETPLESPQNLSPETLLTKEGGNIPTTPTGPENVQNEGVGKGSRIREIGAKVIESADVKQDVKDALLENGIDYIPRGRKFTQTELKELVDIFSKTENGLDKLAETVYDLKNDVKGDTRVTLNVYIANEYSKLLDASTNPKEREKYRNKVADAYIFGQEFATEAGETVEALKQWRNLLSRDPESVIAIRRRQQAKHNDFALQGMEGDIKSAKEMLDAVINSDEFKKIVETEVNKEIDKIADKKYGEADKKKINDFFDGLLIKNDKAFDATVGIPIAVYNGAVLVIKKAVLAGVDITNAIKQAVDYIDEWYKTNYADGKVTSPEWNKDDYVAQMNDQLKPLTKKVKKVKHKLPKNVEETLVDKIYSKMSNATKPQLRRLIQEYITTLEAEGVISEERFKALFARAIGLDAMTVEDEQKIREVAQSLKNNNKVAEKLIAKFKELVEETDNVKIKQLEEEIVILKKETKKAKFEAQKAARKLAGLMTDKSTLGSTIHSLIQANLLTPISLLSNVIGNTAFLPIRHVSYMTASALDFMVSKIAETYTPLLKNDFITKSPRIRRLIEELPTPTREYDYWSATKGYWYGFPQGFEEGLRQMWTGTLPEDQYQQYVSQGLQPWKATLRLRDQLKGKEQIAFDTALANFLEAFPTTYMGEAFFRTLNLGDKPYRRAAERSRLEEIASLKGLTGNQREAFINNPDPDSVEEARKTGDVAVYQQDTVISEMFSWLQKRINRIAAQKVTKRTSIIVSTMGALLKATQAPYVKTPVNLIGEAIDYSIPILSLGRALNYAKEGDKRKSYEYFGKAVVGYMMMSMAFFLLKEGLLTPPPDDDEKVRQAQINAKPGYTLNLDALWRRIDPFDNAKGDSEWKDKDNPINIQRLGVFSMILMGISKAYAQFPQDELQKELGFVEKSLYSVKMIPAEIGASLDQSFLSGTASGIKAFTEGGPAFDKWAISTSRALSAVIYPNTLAQISQVFFDDNYIREVRDMYSRDEKFKKQIINTFKDRIFMGKQLPSKVTLWGEKVNRVPEGESWAHVMFDVTKGVEYQKSSFGVRMFEFYERYKFINETDARKILPSIPDASNAVGWDDRNMTTQEVEQLQINVGQRRKSYVENLMNSEEWGLMSDEERIVELERIYRTEASKVKSAMFMLDVVKQDRQLFQFLENNDLIPIPSQIATIKVNNKKVKLDKEQTAEFYDDVQRFFVERMNNVGFDFNEKIVEEDHEKMVSKINNQWDNAKNAAMKTWKTTLSKN